MNLKKRLTMSTRDKLKELIRGLIRQEMEEASMTGNLDGGAGPPKTPYAFQSKPKSKKDKEKEKAIMKAMGYTKVNEVTNKEITALSNLIKGFDKIQRDYFNIKKLGDKELKDKKYDKVYYKAILDCKEKIKDLLDIFYRKNAAVESVNEGRYHDWRNDESLTPKQKIGMSVREVRHALDSLDKTIKMNVRLKNELNVDSRNYWKNTHKALSKISERLVKLATKVGSLK